jgi:hypothetical protein
VRHITPFDFRDDFNSHLGSAFSLEPILTQSAWFRPHNRDAEIPNLFLVGAGTHPGRGRAGGRRLGQGDGGAHHRRVRGGPRRGPDRGGMTARPSRVSGFRGPILPSLVAAASATIGEGSTSFAAAARLLDPATRESAALLYAWCRHCDDVIDGQTLGHAARPSDGCAGARLDALERATRAALAGRPPDAFPFRALAAVAERHAVPPTCRSPISRASVSTWRSGATGRSTSSWSIAGASRASSA